MAHDEHHEHLVKEVEELFKPVLEKSPQAMYIYLDDEHKTCNQKFADLLGYSSIQEWVSNEAALSDVLEEDQEKVINAYMKASDNLEASVISVTFAKKDKTKVKVKVILTPVAYKGENFVVHFIEEE